MKTFNRLSVVIFILFAGYWPIHAQKFTENKRIVKSFKVDNGTTVDISNKYGKIHIVPWAKDSVRIEINVKINSDSEEKIKELTKGIDFDFTQAGSYVIALTDINFKQGGLLQDIKEITGTISGSNNEVQINYKVFVPSDVDLKITNKYGDIYANDLKGKTTIVLSNGDLKVNNISGVADIDVKFGDAVINSINSGRVTLFFSELYLKEAQQINLDSKSSKVTIDKVDQLKMVSKRDKLYLKEINNMYGSSSFTDFWIYNLNIETSFNVRYGQMNFESISNAFSFINLTSRYTDMNLYFESGSSYELDITEEEVEIVYPLDQGSLERKKLEGEEKKFLMYGKLGKNNSTSKVKINAKEGRISIFHK